MRLRVVTYNIRDGGAGREDQLARVLAALQPGVALLQEVAGEALVAALGQQLGMAHYVAPGNAWRQVALLSKLPIIAATSHHPKPPIQHSVLQASLGLGASTTLHVFGVHLVALPFFAMELQRVWEVRVLSQLMTPTTQGLSLLAGDFNASAPGDRVAVAGWPPWLRWLLLPQGGRVLRWAVRSVIAIGLVDCFRTLHPGEDGFTLPASAPNTRLDYIFASEQLAAALRRCAVVSQPGEVMTASDHRPVVAEFELGA